MNLIETMKLKSKLKKNDFKYIKEVIIFEKNKILSLNSIEQQKIINYLVEHNEIDLLSILFSLNNQNLRKRIIETSKNSMDYRFFDSLIKECLKDIIEYATFENDHDLILYLARYITNNNINNNEFIALIKDYLLKHKVDKTFVKIACLPLFRSSELEDKIIASNDYILIINYIINSNKTSRFLKKYILSNRDFEEFKTITRELKENSYQSFMNFKRLTLEAVQDGKISSRYLLIIIKNDRNDKNIDKYIKALIKLNDLEVIRELMTFIGIKGQETYASWALREKDTGIILTLACTTNCLKTKALIDYVLQEYRRTYVNYALLVSNLEGVLLEYTIDKIYKESGEYAFMKVFNFLTENEDKNWITMIDYIQSNCILYNFSTSNFTILLKYRSKLEDIRFEEELNRIRNFT